MATAVMPQREIIRFEPGRPETVCLKYATGKEVNGAGGPQFMFTTVDNRIFFIDPDVAYSIEKCGVRAGDPITITKTKGPRNAVNWEIRPADEKAAPAAAAPGRVTFAPPPEPDSAFEMKLRQSIELAQQARAVHEQAAQQPVTTTQAKLLAAFCVAIDSAVEAMAYAQRRGLPLTPPTFEDIRCSANTIMINAERGTR